MSMSVSTIGVIGTDIMGNGIAQVAATKGSYKCGPLTADWMAERLAASRAGSGVRSGNHTDDVIFDRHADVSEASLEGRPLYPSRLGAFAPSTSG
jgi:3-hydroxyacyl-CoA dehydrogenase